MKNENFKRPATEPVMAVAAAQGEPEVLFHFRKVVTETVPVQLVRNGKSFGQILDDQILGMLETNQQLQSFEMEVPPQVWDELKRGR